MDFTPLLPQLRQNREGLLKFLGSHRLVFCLGNRTLLGLLAGFPPEQIQMLGGATDADTGLELVERLQPQVLVVSDQLEQGSGMGLVLACKQRWPQVRTLLLVSQVHRLCQLREVIDAGCDGVVLESRIGHGALRSAVHTICGGGIYIDRELRPNGLPGGLAGGPSPLQPLSPREREVLGRMVEGDSNRDIAAHLMVSTATVKTHVRRVVSKLQARGRAHAVAIGMRLGLVDWSETGSAR